MAERERGAASRLCSDVFTLSSERDSVATKVTSCIKHGVLVVGRLAIACIPSGGGPLYLFFQLNIVRCWLSVAVRPAAIAGMRSGGRRDVAVNARMIVGVEPSRALRTVIGTIAETSTLLRQ
jgi:hypothetical protein